MQKTIVRIILDILLFLSVFLLPWWGVVLGAVLILVLFQAPEIIIAGVFLDALYRGSFLDIQFFFTLLFLILFIGARYLRRYVIVYD